MNVQYCHEPAGSSASPRTTQKGGGEVAGFVDQDAKSGEKPEDRCQIHVGERKDQAYGCACEEPF